MGDSRSADDTRRSEPITGGLNGIVQRNPLDVWGVQGWASEVEPMRPWPRQVEELVMADSAQGQA